MNFLIFVIVIGLIWYAVKIGFNIGCIVGGIIGIIIGSNLGIAGGGSASNGWIIFGAIGFFVGGLISKKKWYMGLILIIIGIVIQYGLANSRRDSEKFFEHSSQFMTNPKTSGILTLIS